MIEREGTGGMEYVGKFSNKGQPLRSRTVREF